MAFDFDQKKHVLMTTGDPMIDPPLILQSATNDIVLDGNVSITGMAEISGVYWPNATTLAAPGSVGKFLAITEGPEIGLADAPSSGSSAVADLTDVSLEGFFPLESGHVLAYETGIGWINRPANGLIEIPEPPAVALDGLSDVSIGGMFAPSAGDVLTYEAGTGWFNRPLTDLLPPGGGDGGGASVLDDLTDVSIGTPLVLQSGDVLTYEAGTGWFNRQLTDLLPPPVEIPEPEVAVADLTDVVLGNPFTLTSGDSLVFESGMGWINRPLSSLLGTGTNGQVLTTGEGGSVGWSTPQGGSTAPRTATIPYASEVTIDWSNKDVAYLTLSGTAIISMTGAVDGQKLLLVVRQDATGGRAIAFGGDNIRFGTTAAEINLSTDPEKNDKIGMIYDGLSGTYDVVAFAGGF